MIREEYKPMNEEDAEKYIDDAIYVIGKEAQIHDAYAEDARMEVKHHERVAKRLRQMQKEDPSSWNMYDLKILEECMNKTDYMNLKLAISRLYD